MKERLGGILFLVFSVLLLVFSWSCYQYQVFAQGRPIEETQIVETVGTIVYIVLLLPLVYWRICALNKPRWLIVFSVFPPALLGICLYLSFAKKTMEPAEHIDQ